MSKAQRNLLIFLCVLIFLTVVAVLLANFGIPWESSTTQSFAKWGQTVVLAEIIGLFLIVGRSVFTQKIRSYSIILTAHKDLPEPILSRVSWDKEKCFVEYDDKKLKINPASAVIPDSE